MSQEFTSDEMQAKIDEARAKDEQDFMERKKMLEPLAMDILTIITNNRPSMNDSDMDKLTREYTPIYSEVMQLCLDKGLYLGELEYVFKIVRQAVEILENLVIHSINEKKKNADNKLWGVDKASNLTLAHLDNVLTSKQQVQE